MTNRMILQDPMLGQPPVGSLGWSGVQRQLAVDTAPGYESRVLLVDQTDFTDDTYKAVNNLSLSLLAGVRYYYEYTGMYARTGTNDIKTRFSFTGNAVTTGDRAGGHMADSSNTGVVRTAFDIFTGTVLGTNSADKVFFIYGWFSCTTAGVLTVQAALDVDDANDGTMYAGTRIVFQPITNLAYESNP